ncbi:MAG: hypothetical protein ABR929_14360 [Roseiarcus sp.]
MSDIVEMRSRNASIRKTIVRLLPNVTELVQGEVDECAKRQPSTASNDTPEGLTDIFENLRARALILVRSGVAKREDFPEID